MIRSALLRRNRLIRQSQVLSTQDGVVRLFSSQNPSQLRSERHQTDEVASTSVDADNDSNESTQQDDPKSNFVPFFQEVDNLYGSHNSKDGSNEKITSFFQALGDAPPARVQTTMPPPTAASSFDTTNAPSIFDVFAIPDTVGEENASPNAYNEEAYRQYREMVDEIMENDRYRKRHTKRPFTDEFLAPIKTWRPAAEPLVECHLPAFQQCVEKGLDSQDDDVVIRDELNAQREAFLQEVSLDDKQYKHAIVALVLIGNLCAKRARSLPLDVAWEKVKEAGILLEKTALNSYLYSCTMYVGSSSTMFSSGDSVLDMLGSPLSTTTKEPKTDENGEEKYIVNLPEEVATFHDLLYEPTEESVTIRIKALVAKGNPTAAEALLSHFSGREEGRQRTYLPILRCYLEQGDFSAALRLLKQMRSSPLCILESETYIQLLSTMAERGCFSNDAESIEGAAELGYAAPCGPRLFDDLASQMAEDVLEITSASARRLYAAFESALREQDCEREFVEMHPLAPLPVENEQASGNDIIVSRVVVSDDNGVCPRSGAKLRLIQLEPNEREHTRDSLLKLAESAYQEWNEKWGRKAERNDRALVSLSEFADWLDTREGEPFTAFIDGANIGYYMQNFEHGKFNIYQLEFMVNALENTGETPLVIMPQKYCLPSFNTSGSRGYRQKLDTNEMAIIDRLSEEGKLYRVPQGLLDDYYWMLASVSDQTVARGDRDMDVQPDDESGRWPGMRPMLVTNDQMRDHKLELLEPRLFRRWFSCHIVNYNFTAFVDDECVDKEISFSTADFFSREIQGNPTSDSDNKNCGMAWHFPVSDWEMHERLCIRLPSVDKNN